MSGSSPAHTPAPHGGNPVLLAIGFISKLSGIAAALLIVISIGVTCQMIFIRFVLNGSTVWQTEGVTYMMVAATMLGLPYVQYLRGHVNVDLLPLLLPEFMRKGLALVVLLVTIAVVALMFWHGYHFWHEAWDWGETSNTPWNPKLWVPYLALPLGFGLYLLQLVADLIAVVFRVEEPFGLEPGATLADSVTEAAE
ncbi:TRAP transporter small permease [Maribius pontilimi]|uniref:TRAP transporter small permease protein n=1 Tax=Palleronia pontilimi TaxID=1964209 RepID=A0A934MDD0_9RHOB|nr:TRAP transporter small permease [Palleronia pontilimi]MBJ3763773.1 TRAP transporter small permease [Palleronia pontilimi]